MLKCDLGSIPATIQSIICNRAAGGLFSLLQPAGATGLLQSMGTTALLQSGGTATVLSSVGATVAGAATTSAGVVLTVNGEPIASASRDLLQEAVESVQHCDNPDDGEKGIPPPDHATVTEKYLLTLLAILAIVKSWDVGTYDPPGTNCTSWLCEVHGLCKQYGVPLAQRALCAMHRMRADCKEAAHNAKCHDMTWDEFTAWLCQYDRKLYIPILTSAPYSRIPQVRTERAQIVPVLSFHPGRQFADIWAPGRIAELQANTLEK